MPWRKEKQNQLPRNMAKTGHPEQETNEPSRRITKRDQTDKSHGC